MTENKSAQELQNDQKPLLTFNALYNILRTEKKQKQLQKFPELFYEALEEFISKKKQEIKTFKENKELDKAKKENNVLQNSLNISKELIALRTQKISKIAAQNTLFEETILEESHVLPKEKEMYDSIIKNIKKLQTFK